MSGLFLYLQKSTCMKTKDTFSLIIYIIAPLVLTLLGFHILFPESLDSMILITDSKGNKINDNSLILIILIMSFSIISVVFLFQYLTRDPLENSLNRIKADIKGIEIKLIENIVDEKVGEILRNKNISKNIKLNEDDVKNIIANKLDNIIDQTVLTKIESLYGDKIVEELKYDEIDEIIDYVKERIQKETNRLVRNSNVNLIIGIFSTMGAIAILSYALIGHQNTDPSKDLMYYLPRITLSVFIELFSFYFLKLYKINLEEIKYLNNEKTNIDMRVLAIKMAVTYKPDKIESIIENLLKTERNYILKKDESTIDIERSKVDNKFYEKIVGIFESIKSKTDK